MRLYRLGWFPLAEFRGTAIVAAKSVLKTLREMNPLTGAAPQVSHVAELVAGLDRAHGEQ